MIRQLLPENAMDLSNPFKRARESLLLATRVKEDQFLPHYILGWTFMAEKDFVGAEMAFNTCVRLRPNGPRCYIWRSLALVQHGASLKNTDLIKAGLADHQRAIEIDPNLPGCHWKGAGNLQAASEQDRQSTGRMQRKPWKWKMDFSFNASFIKSWIRTHSGQICHGH